jgi:ATP-dependent Zn protease
MGEADGWVRTIMPRGQALGITFQLPEQDKGEFRCVYLDIH